MDLTWIHLYSLYIPSQVHYKDKYKNEVKGHYIGSYEDIYMLHCKKVEEIKSEVSHVALFLFSFLLCCFVKSKTLVVRQMGPYSLYSALVLSWA